MKTPGKWLAIGMVLLAFVGSAQAAEEEWQFGVTPYLWAMGVNGDIGVGPLTVPVDLDFLDAIENLEFGGMLAAEAAYGDWSLIGDVAYVRLKQDKGTPAGDFSVRIEEWTAEGALVYAVAKGESTILDAGLGCRYMSLDTKLTPPGEASQSVSEDWADPLFVLRLRQQFNEKFFGVLYGDMGGFGVSSKLTWQVIASVDYAFNETFSLVGGYRYTDYDYSEDAFSFDAAESGLVLGLRFNL